VDPDKCKEGGKNSICSMGGNSNIVHNMDKFMNLKGQSFYMISTP